MCDVSFVLTVYNKAAFLPDVFNALKQQSGSFTCEYIIINDGSTDHSLDLVKNITRDWDNVKIIDQDNQGVAIATNRAIEQASGDYIKLVDGDDILAPFATELLLDTAQKANCGFVFGISEEYEDTPVFHPKENPQYRIFPDPLDSVIERGFARVSHCLFKKDMFEQVSGCDMRIFSQDHSLFIRLASLGQLAQVMETVCLSPKDEPARIMNNEAQVIHDATLALAYFIQDGQRFGRKHKKAAQKKIVSRMWKWAHKVHGESYFSVEFLIYLVGRMGWPYKPTFLIELCKVFRKNATIRQP